MHCSLLLIVKRSSSRGLEALFSTDTQNVRHISTSGMYIVGGQGLVDPVERILLRIFKGTVDGGVYSPV